MAQHVFFQNTSEDENPPACPPEGVAADVLAAGGERLLAVNGEIVTGHEAGTQMLKSAVGSRSKVLAQVAIPALS